MKKLWLISLGLLTAPAPITITAHMLETRYTAACNSAGDGIEHISRLASECSSVLELGLWNMNTTWGIFNGLKQRGQDTVYYGIDSKHPAREVFLAAQHHARDSHIEFNFFLANELEFDITRTPHVDMIIIDTVHTYCQLTCDLEKFESIAQKYIVLPNTDKPWGFIDDYQQYHGDRSEYPSHVRRDRVGTWAAVVDFLDKNTQWKLIARHQDHHGFTILERRP